MKYESTFSAIDKILWNEAGEKSGEMLAVVSLDEDAGE